MMRDDGDIQLCEPAPFIYYENGQMAVTDGASVWLVIVTCEAMRATASPPVKSLGRLKRFAAFYRDLASAAIRRHKDVDGKVWVNEADVKAAISSGRDPSRRLALKRQSAASFRTEAAINQLGA
jgi:hypothetical protein